MPRLLSVVSAALFTTLIAMGVDWTIQLCTSSRFMFIPTKSAPPSGYHHLHSSHQILRVSVSALPFSFPDTYTGLNSYKALHETELLDEHLLLPLFFRDEEIKTLQSKVEKHVDIVGVSPQMNP
ncbi:hypothetical protein ARMGADRAFT_1022920 [Armillaria gallica]|uniref:Uncharacterized protein n=1 Tax=Armillaria gallica TaxID=47427 RepID=A0A2H3EPY1_ARMGA|nr:hypothetical protein ARMGADRAFT_1022920 [Armillaria gallica]